MGSFFPSDGSPCPEWDEYKTGSKQVPVTTYILGPTNYNESKFYAGMDNGGDLCDNVVCLGRCGIFKTADGLRDVFLLFFKYFRNFYVFLQIYKNKSEYPTWLGAPQRMKKVKIIKFKQTLRKN